MRELHRQDRDKKTKDTEIQTDSKGARHALQNNNAARKKRKKRKP